MGKAGRNNNPRSETKLPHYVVVIVIDSFKGRDLLNGTIGRRRWMSHTVIVGGGHYCPDCFSFHTNRGETTFHPRRATFLKSERATVSSNGHASMP